MSRLLSVSRGFLARECHAGLIRVRCFNAAEGGDRGRHHDAIDGSDDREERDEIQQYCSSRQLSRAGPGSLDGMDGKTVHHGPRKLSTALTREPSFESVM